MDKIRFIFKEDWFTKSYFLEVNGKEYRIFAIHQHKAEEIGPTNWTISLHDPKDMFEDLILAKLQVIENYYKLRQKLYG